MKVVDYKTGYMAIAAYNNSDIDTMSGEPTCSFALVSIDHYLLESIVSVRNILNRICGLYGSNFLSSNIESVRISLLNCNVNFFGSNPDKINEPDISEILSLKPDRNWILYVDGVDNGYDKESDYNDGTIQEYSKDYIKLTDDFPNPEIILCPSSRDITFVFNPDSYTDYKTIWIKLDYLIDFVNDNSNN